MIYFDNWVRKDIPHHLVIKTLYTGPRHLGFREGIESGYFDDIMKPEILKYYKEYFTKQSK